MKTCNKSVPWTNKCQKLHQLEKGSNLEKSPSEFFVSSEKWKIVLYVKSE